MIVSVNNAIRTKVKAAIELFCCKFAAGYIPAIIFITIGLIEASWGTLQLFGFLPSGHLRYPVTGSFYNPGPFGCFIGCILPPALWLYKSPTRKWIKLLAVSFILLATLLLPGGMSRTGWIAAAMGCGLVFIGFCRPTIRRVPCCKLLIWVSTGIMIFAGCCFGAYLIKPDSAEGRLLMWKIAAQAVADCPLIGTGWEKVAGTYGNAQEKYFATGLGTTHEEILAGTPAYVFNEYLQIAIAFGIPAAILFASMLIISFLLYWQSAQYGLAGIIVALMITCFSSYPFQFIEFKLLIVIAIPCSLWLIRHVPLKISAFTVLSLVCIVFLVGTPKVDISKDYSDAQQMYRIGRHRESIERLKQVMTKTSDPMPLNLIGKNFQALGEPDSAAHFFTRAANRVPNRLYPHYLLMKLYADNPKDSVKMREEADILLTKQAKVHSKAIDEMRMEAIQHKIKKQTSTAYVTKVQSTK